MPLNEISLYAGKVSIIPNGIFIVGDDVGDQYTTGQSLLVLLL